MTTKLTGHIENLIRVTARLIGVMNSEVEMLRGMRLGEIGELQEEKLQLTALYEEAVHTLSAQPNALEAMAPALRDELANMAVKFDASLAENAFALHAVKQSHDRLLRTIVDTVSDAQKSNHAYTAKGTLNSPKASRNTEAVSIALDRQL
jgi:hypothetical protein